MCRMPGMRRPTRALRLVLSDRAAAFNWKSCLRIASITRARASGDTLVVPLRTLETVDFDTPASWASPMIVTGLRFLDARSRGDFSSGISHAPLVSNKPRSDRQDPIGRKARPRNGYEAHSLWYRLVTGVLKLEG